MDSRSPTAAQDTAFIVDVTVINLEKVKSRMARIEDLVGNQRPVVRVPGVVVNALPSRCKVIVCLPWYMGAGKTLQCDAIGFGMLKMCDSISQMLLPTCISSGVTIGQYNPNLNPNP